MNLPTYENLKQSCTIIIMFGGVLDTRVWTGKAHMVASLMGIAEAVWQNPAWDSRTQALSHRFAGPVSLVEILWGQAGSQGPDLHLRTDQVATVRELGRSSGGSGEGAAASKTPHAGLVDWSPSLRDTENRHRPDARTVCCVSPLRFGLYQYC